MKTDKPKKAEKVGMLNPICAIKMKARAGGGKREGTCDQGLSRRQGLVQNIGEGTLYELRWRAKAMIIFIYIYP